MKKKLYGSLGILFSGIFLLLTAFMINEATIQCWGVNNPNDVEKCTKYYGSLQIGFLVPAILLFLAPPFMFFLKRNQRIFVNILLYFLMISSTILIALKAPFKKASFAQWYALVSPFNIPFSVTISSILAILFLTLFFTKKDINKKE